MMSCFISKVFGIFVVTAIICLVAQKEVWAEFVLTPGISLHLEYDDNLFLTDEDKVDDFSTIIVPSLSLLFEKKILHTNLNYSLEFRKYLNETYLDEDKIKDIHRGEITGSFFPENQLSILFEGSIARESVDDRRSDVEENNVTNMTTRYDGLIRPRYLYRLTPKIKGELAYQFSTSQYDGTANDEIVDNETGDIVDHDVSLQMYMEYSEKLELQIETYHNWHEADEFDDYEMWYGLAGFTWRPVLYWSLEANAGGAITNVTGEKDNLKDSLFRVTLEYSKPEKLTIFASYVKDFETSIDDGRYLWWETEGGVSYGGRLSGEFTVYTRENTYQFVNREEEIYGFDARLDYDLTSQVSTAFFAAYSHRTYRPVTEKTHRYRAGCSLTRSFQHSSIALRYVFNANDSDVQINDYQSNIVFISFNVQF